MEKQKSKIMLSAFQFIIIGFVLVILIGTGLLMFPFATQNGTGSSFFDALFTATSAVCVTGLVVQDTATYWSYFGQAVILLLIQVGGMGVVTVGAFLMLMSGKKISFMQRNIIQEAVSAQQVGGVVRLIRFIVIGTFGVELLGACAMMPVFCKDFGAKGIWMSFFHSISAFCNAGFDLMGINAEYSSLTSYAYNPVINVVIMLLIVIGGIGFLTWDDVVNHKYHLRKYRVQSKLILLSTAILIVIPALFLFCFEVSDLPLSKRIMTSLFQAITPRTAGFNTIDYSLLSEAGVGITILLMLIGGAPGSTAGGMKTTTIAVLFANVKSVFCQKKETEILGRSIVDETIKKAATILLMYVTLFFSAGVLMSLLEGEPMMTCLFETASAIGTVGLTLGITPGLGIVSRSMLIFLMFFGRVGGLTLIYAAVSGINSNLAKLPKEKVMVG